MFIHSPVDGHLAYLFSILAVKNIDILVFVRLLKVKLLGHMIAMRNYQIVSKVTISFCILFNKIAGYKVNI